MHSKQNAIDLRHRLKYGQIMFYRGKREGNWRDWEGGGGGGGGAVGEKGFPVHHFTFHRNKPRSEKFLCFSGCAFVLFIVVVVIFVVVVVVVFVL